MVAVSPDERKEPVPTSLKVFLVGLGFARTKSLERPARPFLTAVDRRPTYLNLPSTAGQSLLEDQLRFLSTTRVIPKNVPLSLPPTRFLERERHENPSSTSHIFSFDAAVFFFFFSFFLPSKGKKEAKNNSFSNDLSIEGWKWTVAGNVWWFSLTKRESNFIDDSIGRYNWRIYEATKRIIYLGEPVPGSEDPNQLARTGNIRCTRDLATTVQHWGTGREASERASERASKQNLKETRFIERPAWIIPIHGGFASPGLCSFYFARPRFYPTSFIRSSLSIAYP